MNLKNKIFQKCGKKIFLSSFNNFPRRAPAGGPAGNESKNEKIKFPKMRNESKK